MQQPFLQPSYRQDAVAAADGYGTDDVGHRLGRAAAGRLDDFARYEGELAVGNDQYVAIAQDDIVDAVAIDEGAIGAAEVADVITIPFAHDDCMFARDARRVDLQVGRVDAANREG